MDFTIKKYQQLLESLQNAGFFFQTFAEYAENKEKGKGNKEKENRISKFVVLRHDVDLRPGYSLRFAQIQAEHGIKATYYFRIVPESFDEKIILEIAKMGHEIGYHYETIDTVARRFKKEGKKFTHQDLIDAAYEEFCNNLEIFQKLVEVKTVSMHGSPLSKYDNRDLWARKIKNQQPTIDNRQSVGEALRQAQGDKEKLPPKACMFIPGEGSDERREMRDERAHRSPLTSHRSPLISYDYRKLGIIAEPYFDLDFNEVFYITDTGRRWDGHLFNLRDKATKENPVNNPEFLKLRFHSTRDIINAVENGTFPKQAMLNFHPQRWNDAFLPWMKELFWQNAKNQAKRVLILVRKK